MSELLEQVRERLTPNVFKSGGWCEAIGLRSASNPLRYPGRWMRLAISDGKAYREDYNCNPYPIEPGEFIHLVSLAELNGHSWTPCP